MTHSPSPLAKAEEAKRRRDLAGELDALAAGQSSLEDAPWYPAKPGDVVHVRYDEVPGVMPAHGETYLVDGEPDGWLSMRLLASTRIPDFGPGGDFAVEDDPNPLMDM